MAVRIVALALMVCAMPAFAQSAAQRAAEYNAKGVAQYKAEQFDDALKSFLQAYQAAPDNATVRNNLCNAYQAQANVFAKTSDFANAARYLDMAISVSPDNPKPLLMLGACRLRLNHVSEAIARLEEAVDLDPYNVDAHELLGDAYYRDDDIPSALAQWEWVKEVRPDTQGLSEKIQKAYREESVERNYRPRSSRHFQARYEPDTSGGDVSRALTLLERAYRDIGLRLGGVYPPGPILVKVYTAKDFSAATQLDEHVGAVYDGAIRLPIVDKSGQVLNEAELKRRLYHEYTHVVVRHIVGDNVPWWLNEGLAETLSNDLTPEDVAKLEALYAQGQAFPLSGIEQHQLKVLSPEALGLAYVQSHATVNYLLKRFGQRSISTMLDALAEGAQPEQALQQAYRKSYALLEREVARQYGVQ